MKSTDIIQPTVITQPVAVNGTRNNIPESPAGSNYASIEEGFPDVTMISPTNGGLPPFGQDFNGLFYLSTDQKVYLQNGGVITYNEDVATSIGGYPQGAILDYVTSDGTCAKVQSLIDDNSNNFVKTPSLIDGVNWQLLNYGGALNHSQITDCILSTPDTGIDLSITDGVLTLASGAKVIIPYGTSEPELSEGDSLLGGTIVDVIYDENEGKLFYIVQYDEDKTDEISYTNSNLYLIFNAEAALIDFASTYITSGSTAPTSSFSSNGYGIWYDTEENYVKMTGDSGSSWINGLSLPIGRAASSADSGYTKILQVFSASGFIDKTVWINKGVTFLMPNGRNDDGTLKNIEYTTDAIYTSTITSSTYNNYTCTFTLDHIVNDVYYPVVRDNLYYVQTYKPDTTSNCLWYNPETNIFTAYRTSAGGWFEETAVVFATINYDTTRQRILPGVLKNTFQAADASYAPPIKWVSSYLELGSSLSLAGGSATMTFDLSEYLPDDGNTYDVVVQTTCRLNSLVSGATGILYAYTDIFTNKYTYCFCRLINAVAGSNYLLGGNTITVTVGSGRYITFINTGSSSSYALNSMAVNVFGYRRANNA